MVSSTSGAGLTSGMSPTGGGAVVFSSSSTIGGMGGALGVGVATGEGVGVNGGGGGELALIQPAV